MLKLRKIDPNDFHRHKIAYSIAQKKFQKVTFQCVTQMKSFSAKISVKKKLKKIYTVVFNTSVTSSDQNQTMLKLSGVEIINLILHNKN